MSRLKQVHDWRDDKPTDEQTLALYKAGYSLESARTMTKGECSDIISEYKQRMKQSNRDECEWNYLEMDYDCDIW